MHGNLWAHGHQDAAAKGRALSALLSAFSSQKPPKRTDGLSSTAVWRLSVGPALLRAEAMAVKPDLPDQEPLAVHEPAQCLALYACLPIPPSLTHPLNIQTPAQWPASCCCEGPKPPQFCHALHSAKSIHPWTGQAR